MPRQSGKAIPKQVLVLDIWQDILRYSMSYLLLIMVVASAFSVIYYTHVNRQTTSELELLLTERDEFDIEWRNLLLEQNSLAEHSAIESKAEKLLNMKRPDANSEVIVTLE
ncbi:MAG: cell division protein FtsL [Litorilituus sp.]|jgi:cell division protein FtsL|nr:cell division protein FtsL [Litorilituus sp.]